MEIPNHWRLKAQRYRLEGSICPTCGQVSFPPRPVCPHCSAQAARVTSYGLTEITISQRTLVPVSTMVGPVSPAVQLQD